MKFLFAIILIAIALYFIIDQQGGIDPTLNNIKTGKAAAILRGY